jgi:hypothetical protein
MFIRPIRKPYILWTAGLSSELNSFYTYNALKISPGNHP